MNNQNNQMKKTFTAQEFVNSAGCWKTNKMHELKALSDYLSNSNQKLIHFKDVLESPLVSLKDKRWWIKNSCKLTTKELQYWALESAKNVAHIYNKKYSCNSSNQSTNIRDNS